LNSQTAQERTDRDFWNLRLSMKNLQVRSNWQWVTLLHQGIYIDFYSSDQMSLCFVFCISVHMQAPKARSKRMKLALVWFNYIEDFEGKGRRFFQEFKHVPSSLCLDASASKEDTTKRHRSAQWYRKHRFMVFAFNSPLTFHN